MCLQSKWAAGGWAPRLALPRTPYPPPPAPLPGRPQGWRAGGRPVCAGARAALAPAAAGHRQQHRPGAAAGAPGRRHAREWPVAQTWDVRGAASGLARCSSWGARGASCTRVAARVAGWAGRGSASAFAPPSRARAPPLPPRPCPRIASTCGRCMSTPCLQAHPRPSSPLFACTSLRPSVCVPPLQRLNLRPAHELFPAYKHTQVAQVRWQAGRYGTARQAGGDRPG